MVNHIENNTMKFKIEGYFYKLTNGDVTLAANLL